MTIEKARAAWNAVLRRTLAQAMLPLNLSDNDKKALLRCLESWGIYPQQAAAASRLSPNRWWQKVETALERYIEALRDPPPVAASVWGTPWASAARRLKALGVDPTLLLKAAQELTC